MAWVRSLEGIGFKFHLRISMKYLGIDIAAITYRKSEMQVICDCTVR